MRRRSGVAVLVAGAVWSWTAVLALSAQETNAPLPLNPIVTTRAGQKSRCTTTATETNGNITGTTTCVPVVNAPLALPGTPGYVAAAAAAEQAQRNADREAVAKQKASEASKTSAQQNSFPGEEGVPQVNSDGSVSAAPATPQPASSQPAANAPDAAGSSSSSSSNPDSSSSSSSSSNSAGDNASGDNGSGDNGSPLGDAAPAPKRERVLRPQSKPVPTQTEYAREREDVKVGNFYMDQGNYRGAYDRAKDAVSIQSDDWMAHLLLADAARKMGKLDEAQKEYRKTLSLDPFPKAQKAAEKALKQMDGPGGDTLLP